MLSLMLLAASDQVTCLLPHVGVAIIRLLYALLLLAPVWAV